MILTACQSNTYSVKGEAKGMADGTNLYLATGLDDAQPLDTLTVMDGRFQLRGETDTTLLCRLYPADKPEVQALFFLEPGHIYIELSQVSRVSGTKVNNEWQALNDIVAQYDLRLRQIVGSSAKADSISTRKLYDEVSQLYDQLNSDIMQVAQRNEDNALGRFISTHYSGQ